MSVTHKREEPFTWTAGAAAILRSSCIGTVCALLIATGAAALCYFGLVPVGVGKYTAIAAALLGAFIAGNYAARSIPTTSGIWIGATAGMTVFLLLLSIGMIAYRIVPESKDFTAGLIPCLCGGALAGILFAKPKKKRRK